MQSIHLSDAERLARLRLIRSENVGPVTFRQLITRFGSAEEALLMLPMFARRGGLARQITIYSQTAAQAELQAAARIGAALLFWGETGYPEALAAVEDAPPLLFLRGHAHLLQKPMVAIVGSRNASTIGRKIAGQIAQDLGKAGYTVVSGLARGIDGAAHAASLATGTAAILAGGVDVIYPREHDALYEHILNAGVLVSEIPLGTEPQARHFPRRNRIISGLCRGVVVVEANLKSGSLITASYALAQGREVFAVPGSPLDPRAQGANQLLREGATVTESAADVLAVLASLDQRRIREPAPSYVTGPVAEATESDLADARAIALNLLNPVGVSVDDLIRSANLQPSVILTIILELELAGRVERQPGNKVALMPL